MLLVLGLALLPRLALAAAPSLEAQLRARFESDEEVPGMRVRRLEIGEHRAVLGIELPRHIRLADLPAAVENAYEDCVGRLAAERPGIVSVDLLVAHPGEALAPPPRVRPRYPAKPKRFVTHDLGRFPDGQALRGKVIAISPGHGWIWYDSLNDYGTQRGRVAWDGCGDCRGIVEDFETHEIAVGYLIPLLEGAGAQVVLVRERDTTKTGQIVGDGGAGYRELGGSFGADMDPTANGGRERTSTSSGARAEWSLTAQESGPALLSTWFRSGPTRSARARLEVEGPFGLLSYDLDQRSHGRRWSPITRLDLLAGDSVKVRLESQDNALLGFDAMRLGSGVHSSRHPWWEMGCDPFTDYQEAPPEVTANGDVTSRPVYAEFFGADVYLAIHSNASGSTTGTAMGTASYRYNCGTYPDHSDAPPAADCDDPPGSARLQTLVHAAFVDAIKADWDPNWRDRGPKVANFGEVRALDGTPGMLMESAFHDNTALPSGSNARMTENQALHDPRWRRAAAYGFYRGLSQFLVGSGPLLVGPPDEISLKRSGADRLHLRFTPVPGATRYRVYVARGSRSFDQGQLTTDPELELTGLTPGTVVSVRVASLNAAGEGLPSRVVSARPAPRRSQILVVDAFDREDAWVEARDNKHDTAMVHGLALAGTAHAFDGATEAAWRAGQISLGSYDGLVLALGRESTEHQVLNPALRDEVRSFALRPAAVFADGSEIGWALDTRGDMVSQAWLVEVFGVRLGSDDAQSQSLRAEGGGRFAMSMATFELDDGTKGALESKYPDLFLPQAGATVDLSYGGTMGSAAGVRLAGRFVLGVALDSLVDPADRALILGTWANESVPLAPIEEPIDGGVPSDSGVVVMEDAGFDAGVVIADAGSSDLGQAPDAGGGVEPLGDAEVTAGEGCGCSATPRRAPGSYGEACGLALLLALRSWRRRRS